MPTLVLSNVWSPLAIGKFPLTDATCPYIREYGKRALNALEGISVRGGARGVSLFAASCFLHGVPWRSTKVQNTSAFDAVHRWFFACSGDEPYSARCRLRLVDAPCSTPPCNPTCVNKAQPGRCAMPVRHAAGPGGGPFNVSRGTVGGKSHAHHVFTRAKHAATAVLGWPLR